MRIVLPSMVAKGFGYENWHVMAGSCGPAPEAQAADPDFHATIVRGLKAALAANGWADVADGLVEGSVPARWL